MFTLLFETIQLVFALEPKPKRVQPKRIVPMTTEQKGKKQQWICPSCGEMNGATSPKCISCRTQRPLVTTAPDVPLQPSGWECPHCGELNSGNAALCSFCNRHRP